MNRIQLNEQKGLSLIELMVATLISSLLLIGVTQIFLSSKNTYNSNTALARVQENGRFAAEFLAFDIRNAGYKGDCIGTPTNHLDLAANSEAMKAYNLSPPIEGWNDTKPSHFPSNKTTREKTDAIVLKYASGGTDFIADSSNHAHTPNLGVNGKTGVPSGTIVMISNSSGCDIFQNTNNENASTFQTSGGNIEPRNKGIDWSQPYSGPMSVFTINSSLYYIRDNTGRLPSLVREQLSETATPEEIIDGVIDMQITYGLDKNSDRQIDEYLKAGASGLTTSSDWNKVVSARLDFLIISPETNAIDTPQQFVFPAAKGITKEDEFAKYVDGTVTIKQNRIAKIFTTTVGIRNRLP